MATSVTLPDQPQLRLHHFVTLITDAIKPDLAAAKGVDCVTGKQVRMARLPRGLPYAISDDERDRLRQVLVSLPPISSCMPKRLLKRFRAAYRKHKQQFGWDPIIADNRALALNVEDRLAIANKHRTALDTLISEGSITSIDSGHVPVKRYHASSFISRQQAFAYLEKCGLWHPTAVAEKSQATVAAAISTSPSGEPSLQGNQGGPMPPDSQRVSASVESPALSGRRIGKRYFTIEELQRIENDPRCGDRRYLVEKYELTEYQSRIIGGQTISGKRRSETMAKNRADAAKAQADAEAAQTARLDTVWRTPR